MKEFKELQKFIDDLGSTNSTNEKKEKLKNYPNLKKILNYIYDPFKKYNVSPANIEKLKDLEPKNSYNDFYNLLDDLTSGKLSGHEAVRQIRGFINTNKEFEDVIIKVIDKDLKIRLGSKEVNKIFPNLIPSFEIALAKKYDEHKKKVDFDKDVWYGSRKLDGCRCITVVRGDDIKFYSRTGNEFQTLNNLTPDVKTILSSLPKKIDFVLDGEVCLVDENDVEDFQGIMKVIRKKDQTIKNPKYKVFDFLRYEDFINKNGGPTLSKRYNLLKTIIDNVSELKNIDVLDQNPMDEKFFAQMVKEGQDKGWEGIMIRKDFPYEGKRTDKLLKVKKMEDGEFKVIGIETGDFQVIDKKTGLNSIIQTMTRATIEYKGYEVGVGSGYSLEEREVFFKNPDKIIGKEITVQHFGESKNQKGDLSLRFPVFKYLYETKRNV